MFRIVCLLIGYCIGCISMGFIVSKLTKTDLRQKGSGNLGTTNALRVLGFKAGAATFLGDILKSVLAFVLCRMLFQEAGVLAGVYACTGVILGHDFPAYLKFKGGKGIAATLGFIICMSVLESPWIAVVAFGLGIIGVAVSKYISVGSLIVSLCMPIMCFLVGEPTEVVVITTLLCCLAFYLHRANIKRLRAGNENKFTLHKVQE